MCQLASQPSSFPVITSLVLTMPRQLMILDPRKQRVVLRVGAGRAARGAARRRQVGSTGEEGRQRRRRHVQDGVGRRAQRQAFCAARHLTARR